MSQLDRRRLVSSLSREGLDFHTNVEFKKALADYFNSLDAFVAYRSAMAYGRTCFDPKNSDDVALAVQLLQGPPNEYVREAVLGWVEKFPDISNFEGLAPNAVRSSWRVRLAAIGALNAQERGNSKSKIASRQLLLTSTMQESAVVRQAAILCLNTDDSDEKRRLEYAMVNEPCELVRFKALEHYL
ncbi:MAG: HEAT repeat domain-containing protein, partial [Fimbriimonadaceae bacterium]|nr:HEAT repeat domain-containing protein [Fimbriimonadaceae bacterium]